MAIAIMDQQSKDTISNLGPRRRPSPFPVDDKEKSMMKHAFVVVPAALLLALIVGCPRPASTVVNSRGDKKLTLTQPSNVTIARGGNAEVTAKISRDGFRDPVTVTFSQLPPGVEAKDKDTKIAAEATSGTFTLHAKEDAPLVTNHEARITVTGPDNMTQTDTFKITVKEK